MSTFGENYSRYYDLLYKDKDYKSEVDYISEIISRYMQYKPSSLLDIGCGTGKHLKFFKEQGFSVAGVDLSENMISEAKKHLGQDEDLCCGKASEFNLGRKFDVIVSLFHVMSYQTENSELEKVFDNVHDHLNDGGLFIFDFWYGPAVLTDPPVVKVKRLEDDTIRVMRVTEPVMHVNMNTIDVNFEVLIENKNTHTLEVIIESHKMRYLFLPEIDYFTFKSKLKLINSCAWLGINSLSINTWYGLVVVSK